MKLTKNTFQIRKQAPIGQYEATVKNVHVNTNRTNDLQTIFVNYYTDKGQITNTYSTKRTEDGELIALDALQATASNIINQFEEFELEVSDELAPEEQCYAVFEATKGQTLTVHGYANDNGYNEYRFTKVTDTADPLVQPVPTTEPELNEQDF